MSALQAPALVVNAAWRSAFSRAGDFDLDSGTVNDGHRHRSRVVLRSESPLEGKDSPTIGVWMRICACCMPR